MAKEITASAVQSACESDPADADHPNTILITTDDFETIVRCAVENWQDANPQPAMSEAEMVKLLARELSEAGIAADWPDALHIATIATTALRNAGLMGEAR